MKLVAHNLYRGSRPKSFEELKAWRVATVINLESGVFEGMHDDTYERENGFMFGITEHNINCSDIFHPNIWQVMKVMEIIKHSVEKGPVYIHCLHGKDRTGYMCAAYRILECGWSPNKAIEEMYSEGFHKFPYFWWASSLRDLEAL